MIYLQLFYAFFKIGLFSFGGGYAILAFIQKDIVEHYHWISLSEFTELVAISQITPGPISINLATHVGYKMGKILGSTVATLGVVLPSFLVITILLIFLKKFRDTNFFRRTISSLKFTAVGLILGAALTLFVKENFVDLKATVILISVFIAGWFFRVGSIYLIGFSGLAGIVFYYLM